MRGTTLRLSAVLTVVVLVAILGGLVVGGRTAAQTTAVLPVRITADQAFDAVAMGTDPATGSSTRVALVDVRDPVEIFFSGAPAAVDEIHLMDGKSVVPDWGKVRLIGGGKFLEYRVGDVYQRTQVAKVGHLATSQLAVNIPFRFRTASGWVPNPDFANAANALDASYDVLIFLCRSGGRAAAAAIAFDTSLFDAVYVIDDPGGGQLTGGFSGSAYDNVYNGYAAFPDRLADVTQLPAVSWMDAGLPVVTLTQPQQP